MAEAITGMLQICYNKFQTMQYKKIKSRGSEVFNYINEFLNERILFFGKNANRVKQSGRIKLYKYKKDSNIRIVLERRS